MASMATQMGNAATCMGDATGDGPARGAVSVVVPCFEERLRLPGLASGYRTLASLVDEVLIVDDGSSDGTPALVSEMIRRDGLENTSMIRLDRNVGKGGAVSAGVMAAHGESIVFMDADLATDLSDLGPLVEALNHHDVVIGSRRLPGHVVVGGRWYRRMMGRAFNEVVRRTTSLGLSDTQCGFKAFRSQWARVLFSDLQHPRFSFDVEVLIRARELGLSIGEVPVHWTAVDGSHVHPVRDSLRMLRDIREIERSTHPIAPPLPAIAEPS